ncbi:unnamed protein product [Darwinula stevensoni]|uniref:UDP-N-acetylglucosamine transporter n=1 Tax=Darwinula stevensoni TaxID=69355 RepID=A0A7R9AAV6_9CRUS|nr:unnamed protein product [Darwinula stevensoni]CAG0898792.1 unnamed protein product [Darwinula stevensoni]
MSNSETSGAVESETECLRIPTETSMKQIKSQSPAYMKTVSVISLTVQNAALGICMRYSRVRDVKLYIIATAVLMSEVVKCLASLFMVYRDEGDLFRWKRALKLTIIDDPINTLKVGVPSLIYVIQNNLLYVASSNLDVAVYQVTYQLKILTAAMFTVTMLNRRLSRMQWLALLVLVAGVAIVQLSQEQSRKVTTRTESPMTGFLAALIACILSGFAGVYFERILKGSDVSLWMRQVQLALLSIPIALVSAFIQETEQIKEQGFFVGYDAFVWFLIALQALGGLLVAMVMKYADNIMKGFATSLAIVLSCLASYFIFDVPLTVKFLLGTVIVMLSVFLYNGYPAEPPKAAPHIANTSKGNPV